MTSFALTTSATITSTGTTLQNGNCTTEGSEESMQRMALGGDEDNPNSRDSEQAVGILTATGDTKKSEKGVARSNGEIESDTVLQAGNGQTKKLETEQPVASSGSVVTNNPFSTGTNVAFGASDEVKLERAAFGMEECPRISGMTEDTVALNSSTAAASSAHQGDVEGNPKGLKSRLPPASVITSLTEEHL